MTVVIQFPDSGQLTLSERVSAEVRSLLGRFGVSQTTLAEWLNITQPAVSARLRGATEWTIPQIERVADGFAIHPAVLMGGHATGPQPGPGESLPILRARRYSKPQPSDPKVRPLRLVA